MAILKAWNLKHAIRPYDRAFKELMIFIDPLSQLASSQFFNVPRRPSEATMKKSSLF